MNSLHPGVLRSYMKEEGLSIFRELGSSCNYFRGTGGGQVYTFEDLGGKGKIIQGLGALRSEHTILGIKRAKPSLPLAMRLRFGSNTVIFSILSTI